MQTMEFRFLGQLEVLRNGGRLDLGGQRQRALVAVLVLEANRVVSSDRLVDQLWGDTPPPAAVATLQSYVSKLRRVIEPGPVRGTAHQVLVTQPPGYLLRADPGRIDACRFAALAEAGRAALAAGQPERAVVVLDEALSLWRGPALADFAFEDFATSHIVRLEELRLAATEDRIDAALGLGRHRAVVGDLQALVGAHPLRERLVGQLMVALYRSGRQPEATRAYQDSRARLEEVGLEPTAALRALDRAILLQDEDLDWQPPRDQVSVHVATQPSAGESGVAVAATIGGGASQRTGTVTFVHVDLAGTAALWVDDPEGASDRLARYDEQLAGVVTDHGGTLAPRGEAERALAAFPRASDAVAAALALAAGPGGEGEQEAGPLRVRLALCTGEALVRDGHYRGLAVSRGARLAALVRPGQILISQASADLVADHLPPGAGLRDLGTVRLGELDRPEHVFQLCHPQLDLDFPPLPSPDVPLHNLPAPMTSFVGRRQEVAEVRELLGQRRLVTLIGAGGVGKTRLALEVAGQPVDARPDGAWFVDVAPLGDSDLLPGAVGAALGLREQPGRTLWEVLLEELRDRRLLLVLDNCERLVADCAVLVGRLLGACPHLTVLATSREPLGVPGETTWRVPSLSVPGASPPASLATLLDYEAVRLFVERATSDHPGLSLKDQHAEAVATICTRLDGIPLALELAAARVSVLGVTEIAARLDDRFRLLTTGARTAPPRQQTLRSTLDWSHDLLGAEEKTLLRRLSVFTGGFTLEAAEGIAADRSLPEGDILDGLDKLVAKSLVVMDPPAETTRYHLLETIREYAHEKLEQAGEATETEARHREWFVGLAEQGEADIMSGRSGAAVLTRLEADHDNCRRALQSSLETPAAVDSGLRLAHALYLLWEMRNHRIEGRRWMEALLDRVTDASGAASGVARRAANLALQIADLEAAGALYDKALALARQCGDRRHEARALATLGFVRSFAPTDTVSVAGARAMIEEGLHLAEELGDELFVTESTFFLVTLDYHAACYDESRVRLEACRARGKGVWYQSRPLYVLGNIARDQGCYDEARRHFEEYRALARSQEAQEWEAEALDGLGTVAAALGRTVEARLAFESAVALLDAPRQGLLVGPRGGLGELLAAEGDWEAAAALLLQDLETARRSGYAYRLALTLNRLGRVAAARGDVADARRAHGEALAVAHVAEMPLPLADALEGLAVAARSGQPERALRVLAAAAALREAIGAPLAPALRPARDRCLAALRSELGRSGFDNAWVEGWSLPREAAVALATDWSAD